jgi:hypothetical protein
MKTAKLFPYSGLNTASPEKVLVDSGVCHRVTVHNSQGMTVDKAVLGLAEKASHPGLVYEGVGWVEYLKDLMFEESFNLARFRN